MNVEQVLQIKSKLSRYTLRLPRLGIATYLGFALIAVIALVLAANFLVVRAASVEKTVTITQRVVEHAARVPAAPPAVAQALPPPPTVQRVEGTELQNAFRRYRTAVQNRVSTQTQATATEQQMAAEDLHRALETFRTRASDINQRSQASTVESALVRWTSDADALIAQADASADSLRSYTSAIAELDAHAKRSLNHAWKIFGLVITRQTLLQYVASLDELNTSAADLTPGKAADHDTLAAVGVVEDKARQLLETNEKGFRGALGAEWYTTQRDGYAQLSVLRQDIEQRFQNLKLRTEAVSLSGNATLAAIPHQLQVSVSASRPAKVPAVGASPSAEPGAAAAQTVVTEAPVTTQSVVYHNGDEQHRRQLIAVISIGVVALLVAIGAGILISIASPVRRLLDAMVRLSRGDGSVRIERGGIRELDGLAIAFNSMADEMSHARAINVDYQRHLEEKVDERTLQLREYAEQDHLTGLHNRRHFLSLLDGVLRAAESNARLVGIYFIDVDNFKYLNDSLGHAFGDRVLAGLADRLRETIAGCGTAARFGGDEFTVVLESAQTTDEISQAGQRIVEAFQRPLKIDGKDLIVGVSVGASIFPEHGRQAEGLLRAADASLFRAKHLGRSRLAIFTSDLLEVAANNFTIEQGLRRAVERGEFELFFQPEVDAESLQTHLVEALIRWRMPDGQLISPGEFLAVAEESGLIIEICDWVLIKAVQAAARFHHGTWPDVRIAINIFPRQLLDPEFTVRLQNLLTQFRVPPRCIEIELTESVLQTGPTTLAALRELQACGIAIALDDFGTGYSSLSSLQQLPLSRIKLDRSLIADVHSNPRSRAMMRAIIGMCQELGLQITAEGIETPEQFAELREFSGLYLQGYLLSRPVAEDGIQRACEEAGRRAEELALTVGTRAPVSNGALPLTRTGGVGL
jgi:diguanylate cyclase (GGDEF)-like protein